MHVVWRVRSDSQRGEGVRQSKGKIWSQVRSVRRFVLAHGNLPSQYPDDVRRCRHDSCHRVLTRPRRRKSAATSDSGTFRTLAHKLIVSVQGKTDFVVTSDEVRV